MYKFLCQEFWKHLNEVGFRMWVVCLRSTTYSSSWTGKSKQLRFWKCSPGDLHLVRCSSMLCVNCTDEEASCKKQYLAFCRPVKACEAECAGKVAACTLRCGIGITDAHHTVLRLASHQAKGLKTTQQPKPNLILPRLGCLSNKLRVPHM